MKYLILILSLLCACTAPRIVPVKYENQLIITKRYVGELLRCIPEGRYTVIVTSERVFKVCGELHVPDQAHCYIRIIPCYWDVHPDIRAQLERQYFSYKNKEYRVKTW
jgi:hypothetical protein